MKSFMVIHRLSVGKDTKSCIGPEMHLARPMTVAALESSKVAHRSGFRRESIDTCDEFGRRVTTEMRDGLIGRFLLVVLISSPVAGSSSPTTLFCIIMLSPPLPILFSVHCARDMQEIRPCVFVPCKDNSE